MQKRGAQLLHVQCWLWGQDVRRSAGNLLVEQGFARLPAPAGVTGCTQYTRVLQCGACLRLWGFGFLFAEAEGVFLRRYEFVPRRVPEVVDTWAAMELNRCEVCREFRLVARALWEVARMEAAVQAAEGVEYRRRCLTGLKGRAPLVEALPERWAALAYDVECLG